MFSCNIFYNFYVFYFISFKFINLFTSFSDEGWTLWISTQHHRVQWKETKAFYGTISITLRIGQTHWAACPSPCQWKKKTNHRIRQTSDSTKWKEKTSTTNKDDEAKSIADEINKKNTHWLNGKWLIKSVLMQKDVTLKNNYS